MAVGEVWVYGRESASRHIKDSLNWRKALRSSALVRDSTHTRWHAHSTVFDLTQQHEHILVMSLSHPLEYLHGLGLWPGLHE